MLLTIYAFCEKIRYFKKRSFDNFKGVANHTLGLISVLYLFRTDYKLRMMFTFLMVRGKNGNFMKLCPYIKFYWNTTMLTP